MLKQQVRLSRECRIKPRIAVELERPQKGLHQVRVELCAAAVQQLRDGTETASFLVSAFGNHGVKAVGHRQDAGAQWNILPFSWSG